MQARQGTILLPLVDGLYVLALESVLLLLCDPLLMLQVIYLLLWGVGVENVV